MTPISMISSWLTVYRALLLSAMMLGFFLTYQAFANRGKRTVKPLLVLVGGALIYVGVKFTVSLVRGTSVVFLITRLNVLGAALATTGFLLVIIEYTDFENPVSRRTAALLSAEPLVANVLIWIDLAYFWMPLGRDPGSVSGYAWELTSIALANQLYMFTLMGVGIALLVRFGIRSDTAFNNQVIMLIAAGSVPLLGNISYYAGISPFNPTPVLFVLSGLVIVWAVLWEGFLDLSPIGRGSVIENLEAGVLTVDRNHRLVDINGAAYDILGFEENKPLIGRTVSELFERRPALGEFYWTATEANADQEVELEFDGRYYAIEIRELTKPGEAVLGHSIIVRDITARKLREQELKEFKEAVEHAGHGIMITDPDGSITFANSAMEAQTGYSTDGLIGSTPTILNSGEQDDAFFQDMWDTILDGAVWKGELINERKTGEQYIVNQTIAPIIDEGEIIAFVAVNNDITERKEYEQRIETQRDGLDILNQVVRHDIRNDLQMVIAWTEKLEQEIDEPHQEYTERVLTSAEDAVDITVDARELAEVMLRSEADLDAIYLRQTLHESVERFQESTEDVIVEIDGTIPQTNVLADDMLSSVFRNLLKNAIQHNDKEIPEVSVSVTDHGDHVLVQVADNGPGVPDERKTTVFGKGDKGLESEGTGIGLYLVHTLVENYGGDVWVEDNEPCGAIFTVTLSKTG